MFTFAYLCLPLYLSLYIYREREIQRERESRPSAGRGPCLFVCFRGETILQPYRVWGHSPQWVNITMTYYYDLVEDLVYDAIIYHYYQYHYDCQQQQQQQQYHYCYQYQHQYQYQYQRTFCCFAFRLVFTCNFRLLFFIFILSRQYYVQCYCVQRIVFMICIVIMIIYFQLVGPGRKDRIVIMFIYFQLVGPGRKDRIVIRIGQDPEGRIGRICIVIMIICFQLVYSFRGPGREGGPCHRAAAAALKVRLTSITINIIIIINDIV